MVRALVTLADTDRVYGSFEYEQTVNPAAVWWLEMAIPQEISAAYHPPDRPVSPELLETRRIRVVLHPLQGSFGDDMQILHPYTHFVSVAESEMSQTMGLPPFMWLTPRTWDHGNWSPYLQQDSDGRIYLSMVDILRVHRGLREVQHDQIEFASQAQLRSNLTRKTPITTKGPAIGRGKRKLGI